MITSTSARASSVVEGGFNDPGNGRSGGNLPISAIAQSPEEIQTNHLKFALTDEQAKNTFSRGALRKILSLQGYKQEDAPKETKEKRTKRSAIEVDHCDQSKDLTVRTLGSELRTLKKALENKEFTKQACENNQNAIKGILEQTSSQFSCLLSRMNDKQGLVKQHHITGLMHKIASAPKECLPEFTENLRDLEESFPKMFANGLTAMSTFQRDKINNLLKTEDAYPQEQEPVYEAAHSKVQEPVFKENGAAQIADGKAVPCKNKVNLNKETLRKEFWALKDALEKDLTLTKQACKNGQNPLKKTSSQFSCLVRRMNRTPELVHQYHITGLLGDAAYVKKECLPLLTESLQELKAKFPTKFSHALTALSNVPRDKINELFYTEDPYFHENDPIYKADGTRDHKAEDIAFWAGADRNWADDDDFFMNLELNRNRIKD